MTNIKEIIKQQGWDAIEKNGVSIYQFEEGIDTLKIYLTDTEKGIGKLKNELWNTYYSRILLYKQCSDKYKIWTNNQSPESEGRDFDENSFDEKISPVKYWDSYITKTSKNTVDKKLEKSILTVFNELKKKYSDDCSISIILACTFIRFLEDRKLTDVSETLVDALKSKQETHNLFKSYKELHNGMLFREEILYQLDDTTCRILKNFLENNLFDQKTLFRFNFEYIPIELISTIYEKLLTQKLGKEKKKSQGIVYTPPKLANYLVRESFKELDKKFNKKDYLKIKIGDISTGSGIFLVLSFRKLLEKIGKNKTFEEKKEILEKCFYGMDLDKSAINITIFSLYVELLGHENAKLISKNKFPNLNDNIKQQDTLSCNRYNNFFDLIISNPPWKSRDNDSFNKIKGKDFAGDIANKDLSQIFTQISIEKCKEGGIIALVLPVANFYNLQSFKFRQSIIRKSLIKEFVDFSPIRSIVFTSNSIEASVIVAEKKHAYNYIVPMKRVVNKADYLYFNHISGNTNNVDSNFLYSENDSWQIAVRGGNLAVSFIDRLKSDFLQLKNIKDVYIGTGYQGIKTGSNKTISVNYSTNDFNKKIYIVENGDISKGYTNLKKASKSHIVFNERFYQSCVIVANTYKYKNGLLTKYLKAEGGRVVSGDFNIVVGDQALLYFVLVLLTSDLGELLISLRGSKTSFLSTEKQNPKVMKQDIEKLFIPKDYSSYGKVLEIGKKIISGSNVSRAEINKEISRVYKLHKLENEFIKQWKQITNRTSKDDQSEAYRVGFEYMLDSYNLPKPKNWKVKTINGVDIMFFSEKEKQEVCIDERMKKEINNVVTANKNIYFEPVTDTQGVIARRKDSNYGFVTGLLDAELILSSL